MQNANSLPNLHWLLVPLLALDQGHQHPSFSGDPCRWNHAVCVPLLGIIVWGPPTSQIFITHKDLPDLGCLSHDDTDMTGHSSKGGDWWCQWAYRDLWFSLGEAKHGWRPRVTAMAEATWVYLTCRDGAGMNLTMHSWHFLYKCLLTLHL